MDARGRTAAAIAALAAVPLLLGACTAPLLRYKRQLVVDFKPAYLRDQAVHDRVRSACAHLPGVSAVPTPGLLPVTNVVFDTSKANDAQLSRLYQCLAAQPSVASAHQDGGTGLN